MIYASFLYRAVFLNPKPAILAVLLLAAASLAAWRTWPRLAPTSARRWEAGAVSITILTFGLLDWALLQALPLLGLSFGPIASGLAGITLLRLGSLAAAGCVGLAGRLAQNRRVVAKTRSTLSPALLALWIFNLGILACEVDGLYIEPFDLRTTQVHLESPAFLPDRELRIVQLSDIHVERITRRERAMLETVEALQPDLIVLTGDYLNVDYTYDPLTQQQAIQVLGQLHAPYGVYAVLAPGVDNPQVMPQFFGQLANITVLHDEIRRIDFPGQPLYLVGIELRSIPKDSAVLHDLMGQLPAGAYSLLLYHKPDLAYAAAAEQVDLYLAGHTHGGQVRLPFYGAVITLSAFGKRFEAGYYQVDQTSLYVSRGIGMEGLNLPRVRFLCPPEIVTINLGTESIR